MKKNKDEVPEVSKVPEVLKEEVVNFQEQIDDLNNKWKLALADYQNLKRRTEEEKNDFLSFANSQLIIRLIAVLDHFERVQTYDKDEGLLMAVKEFKKVLEDEELSEVEVLGKPFDPVVMEAIDGVDGEEKEKVVEVLEKGYSLKGKIIRPAKVKIIK